MEINLKMNFFLIVGVTVMIKVVIHAIEDE